ncbi:uncharacterized protein F5Z01DRAFT_699541 [Emericellopsis atlantica]|uniref:Uncharacterized protein n=1 Tax=Emericellopsis atlantica TaxID=2614577 RepID=A0A9P8CQL7_9HYPO|nr:uncharacterized protein F5Z01DRAFT_699541 [Emericellopsis atlantica]KAG9255763.1 hypothetical protein F5Z01DRAFT_699541 [Emericellopsis atlantica]
MQFLVALVGLSSLAYSSVIFEKRHDDSYSRCNADRGLEQKDLENAGRILGDSLSLPGGFPMLTDECVYKRENTTIVSICNGNARNRTITQGEAKRGISQLFKDCNSKGTFTGVHVVNNLTFAAYGIYAGINLKAPPGMNPPDTPGSGRGRGKATWLEFVGEGPMQARADDIDCPVGFFGETRTDCARPEDITYDEEDGSCGPISARSNEWLLGPETSAPGEAGEPRSPGQAVAMTEGEETSVSQGFSAGLEGVVKEVFGAGVTYSCHPRMRLTKHQGSRSTAKLSSFERSADPPASDEYWSRWVFFPKLIESCGNISKQKLETAIIGKGGSAPVCKGDVETLKDKCTISPYLVDGEASALWALRYETEDGESVDLDEQHVSYKEICNKADPDGDGEDECTEDEPPTPDE